jgi:hypothetical protein
MPTYIYIPAATGFPFFADPNMSRAGGSAADNYRSHRANSNVNLGGSGKCNGES